MAEDCTQYILGFRQASSQLMRDYGAGSLLKSDFIGLYRNLMALPDGIDFSPLGVAMQHWPRLFDADEVKRPLSGNIQQDEARQFFKRCIESSKKRHDSKLIFKAGRNKFEKNIDVDNKVIGSKKHGGNDFCLANGVVESKVSNISMFSKRFISEKNNQHDIVNKSQERNGFKFLGKNSSDEQRDLSVLLVGVMSSINNDANTLIGKIQELNQKKNQELINNVASSFVNDAKSNDFTYGKDKNHDKSCHVSGGKLFDIKDKNEALAIQCIQKLLISEKLSASKLQRFHSEKEILSHPVDNVLVNSVKEKISHSFSGVDTATNQSLTEITSPITNKRQATHLDSMDLADKIDQALRDQAWLNGVDLS